jgi:hypothetical protein
MGMERQMNETIDDILQLIQEYGDKQHSLWMNHMIGIDYQPAATQIADLIRKKYYDTKTTSDMGEVR